MNSSLPIVIVLSSVVVFPTSAVLSEIADNPAITETVTEAVNENTNPLNNAIDDANDTIDQVNRGIDNAPADANSAVNETIDSVLDQQTQNEIGEAIGTYQQASSLLSRIIGLGQRIQGILANFNLEQILDAINIDLGEITGNVYGTAEGKGASDPLADIEAGALGLPGIDEVDEAIEQAGDTALMETLAGKQEGGGISGRIYLENLYRKNQAEQVADKTALSRSGQRKLAQNSTAANDALKTSTAMMEDSEQQDVSQNVLRNISVQAHEQMVHTGLLALDAQLRARDDSVRNVLMGRTLMEIQSERVSEQRRNAAAYSSVVTSGGLFYLPGLGNEERAID
jgi:hypothetical protein